MLTMSARPDEKETFSRAIGRGAWLRLLTEFDAPPLFRLTVENREHLAAWLPWVPEITTEDDSLRFIRASLDQFARGEGFHAGILSEEALVGVVGLHGISWEERSTSLGYWIAKSHEGRGLVRRAVQAILAWAYEEQALERVEIRANPANRRSAGLAERLGFSREGVLRGAELLNGRYQDLEVYALHRAAWARLRTSLRGARPD